MDRRELRALLAAGVLMALVALVLSACSGGGDAGGQENKKSASGASAPTEGQIVFRRWFDPDQTKGALFTMNPDGSHVRQITPPRAGTTTPRRGLQMGRESPSIARKSTAAIAESWSSTLRRVIHVRLHNAPVCAYRTP